MKGEIRVKLREGQTLQNAARIDAETKIVATVRTGDGKKEEIRVKSEVKVYEIMRDDEVAQANAELATKKAGWTRDAKVAEVEAANAMAKQLESDGQEPLDFSCTIMAIGKTGVGKSSTINSIFDEVKFDTDAFKLAMKKVQDVVGIIQGVKVRVIDTPGLLPSWSDQHRNETILLSVKDFMKKTPPDIVLYFDRLDMLNKDAGDMSLFRTITEIFGPSMWDNVVVVLTHAISSPPDDPNGTAENVQVHSPIVGRATEDGGGYNTKAR